MHDPNRLATSAHTQMPLGQVTAFVQHLQLLLATATVTAQACSRQNNYIG